MATDKILLQLIRLALGKEQNRTLPNDVPWFEVLELADVQGVAAIAADGLEQVETEIPFDIKMECAGYIVTNEQMYQLHEKLMVKLAKAYHKKGIRMMVLKGWGLSFNYPVPCRRPSGDLDIWNFGQWKEADAYLASQGVEIDNSHHHHSVFNIKDLTVENHYDFINTRVHRSSRRLEVKLKELAYSDYLEKNVEGVAIYLPTANFNFLFLLRHMANHFVGKEMTLRQLLDWALLVEHHHFEIDWENDLMVLKECGLLRYFNLMALISVEYLGFSRDIFHCRLEDDDLKERVYKNVIEPEFNEALGNDTVNVILGKVQRWWSNRWKHKLCYPDSLFSAFIFGVWAKIQKPSHFLH